MKMAFLWSMSHGAFADIQFFQIEELLVIQMAEG
jgi:hypothetical protein